jgi:MFS family permease
MMHRNKTREPLTERQALHRFLVVTGLRWLPTGFTIPVITLLMLTRGLTVAEVGLVFAAQGVTVMLLELPSAGWADAVGRRPVLMVAGVCAFASYGLMIVADSTAAFLAVWILQGISRALDSGPLEAWFADAVLARDPGARLERGLGAGAAVAGIAIAAGSVLSGALVSFGGWPMSGSVLTLPVLAAAAMMIAYVGGVAALLREPVPAEGSSGWRQSLRGIVPAMTAAMGLLRRSRVLLALVLVELCWGFGMVSFETLMPIRLAELTADSESAAALLGPITAVAWGVSALGAALAPLVARWTGVAAAAAGLRVLQGATVAAMGLAAGPIGLVTGLIACYLVHGASNPLHQTLLHREVDGTNRASVLSLNSMVAQPAGAMGGIVLLGIAGASSASTAILVGAAVLAVAAPLYVPAWRQERLRRWAGRQPEETPAAVQVSP